MNSVFFSPGSKSFYLQELFPEYEDAGTLPDDVIEITRETYEQFLGLHPEGKEIGADSSGRPIWINSPPPSKEDEVLMAEMERELIVERTKAGLEAARAQGRIGGRRPKLTPEQWAQAGRLIASGVPRQKVAIIYDVGISTLYKKFPVGDK